MMQIAKGAEVLEIAAVIMGRTMTISPTLIWDKEAVILIDAGFPGQLDLFRQAFEKAGVPLARLNTVIVTHQDIDHIGGLPAILNASAEKVEVLASLEEKPFIEGDKRLLKVTPESIAQALAALPPEVPEARRNAFRAALENPPKARVNRTLADGEQLAQCGGITVIKTPGHTPGHLCLYHIPSRTLVAGDALRVDEGRLFGPDPRATLDMATARESLKKLAKYEIAHVVCYHGGLWRGDASRRIAELAQQ